uniref:Uncharacterized protein MANES_06G047000 n=1 Tax=Rhizophora mucronata TaxID=61149 RepID=A0A2P2INL7_RHIMU
MKNFWIALFLLLELVQDLEALRETAGLEVVSSVLGESGGDGEDGVVLGGRRLASCCLRGLRQRRVSGVHGSDRNESAREDRNGFEPRQAISITIPHVSMYVCMYQIGLDT